MTKKDKKIKNDLIMRRNKLLDSFFYIFSKKMRQEVTKIDKELDNIEFREYNEQNSDKELDDQIKRSQESSSRLEALIKSLKSQ